MNDKLTLNKLEKLIELETQLRGEYQQQLDDKDVSIAQLSVDKTTLEAQIAEREKTIATQLATITEFSSKSKDIQAVEQRNRELHNRSDKMKDEVATVKSRIKELQKDLAAERAELAELKKYDPQRLRKNLDASKKKLADKTAAADKLQKSLNQTRAENTQLEQKVKDLEAQVAAVAGACASLLVGTVGGTKTVNAARDALAAARLVSPEGWRQAIETLPVILGLCYAGIGLLHWTEADVLVSTATILWSFCDQSISQAVGAAEVMGALGMGRYVPQFVFRL